MASGISSSLQPLADVLVTVLVRELAEDSQHPEMQKPGGRPGSCGFVPLDKERQEHGEYSTRLRSP